MSDAGMRDPLPHRDRRRPLSRTTSLVLGVLLSFSHGCKHDHYHVELKPRDSSLERKITRWNAASKTRREAHGTIFHPHEKDPSRLERSYGASSYRSVDAPMGATWVYVDRIHGSDDPIGFFNDVQEATASVVALLDA